MEGSTVTVEIFGRNYTIRANDERDYILELAKLVHDKMVEVDRSTKTIDTIRVAVLAALNLADEHVKTKKAYEAQLKSLESEREKLLSMMDKALAEDNKNTLPDS